MTTRDLPSLTAVRAVAALLVFAYHLQTTHVLSFGPAKFGYTGVGFFFILSGFLLTWGYGPELDTGRFYWRRFARIYPNHLVTWAIAFLLPATLLVSPGAVLLNLTLLHAWVPDVSYAYSVNGVAWSLSCEMAFYAAFPFLLRWLVRLPGRARWLIAGVAFAAASAFVLFTSRGGGLTPTVEALQFVNPLVRAPEFVLGMVAALAMKDSWRPALWVLPVSAVVACAGLVAFHQPHAGDVWMAVLALAVVVTLARSDIAGRLPLLRHRWLVYAGKVSFAFYLVHQLVTRNLSDYLTMTPVVEATACLVVSCAGSVALYHAVEIPAQRWITARTAARKRTTVSDPMPL